MITREQMIDRVRELTEDWMRATTSPGIYTILMDPDQDNPDEAVYLTETYSGDNSYIPGDNRITLAYQDVRESISNEDAGLDEDGDPVELGEAQDTLVEEAERRIELAETDGIEVPA